MAQESWNKETDETECHTQKGPTLCANNCGFFGSAITNNLCSKCYRDLVMKQQASSPVIAAEKLSAIASSSSMLAEPAPNHLEKAIVTDIEKNRSEDECNSQPANRCFLCRKRVGLTGFKCRCEGTFCYAHRYPEIHECLFDYKTSGREAIAKENPVVKAEKIEKI